MRIVSERGTTCEDCGCKLSSGICSNCHEELWIETFQGEFMVGKTEDWNERVLQQEVVAQRTRSKEVRAERRGEERGWDAAKGRYYGIYSDKLWSDIEDWRNSEEYKEGK